MAATQLLKYIVHFVNIYIVEPVFNVLPPLAWPGLFISQILQSTMFVDNMKLDSEASWLLLHTVCQFGVHDD